MAENSRLISRNVTEAIPLCQQCEHAFFPSDIRPSASFAEQCRGFYTPSKGRGRDILREISRLEGVVNDYDRELTRLRDIATQLESGRAQVQTHIDSYTSLLSAPVRRLRNPLFQSNHPSTLSLPAHHDPDRILKRIFTFACYRDEDEHANSHLQWLTPLKISHVCSHWRKISLDLPEMWSYLDVSGDLDPESNRKLLHAYIARARTDTPLSVRIELDRHFSYMQRHVLNLILDHADRWREAIIVVDHQQLWRFLSFPFDILEKLVLRIGNIQSNRPVDNFKFAPRLRYVKVDAALSALSFPFSVRRIDLRGRADHSDVVRLEAHQLDVPDLHLSLFPVFRDAPVRLTNLQALTVHALSPDFEAFAQTVTMPHLNRLNIVFDKDHTYDISSFHSLLSTVERSECQLSAFSMDMTHCPGKHHQSHIEKLQTDENELRDFLDAIPSITELRVVEPRGSNCEHCNIITMLLWWLVVADYYDTSSLTLPNLRKLELVWTAAPDVGALVTMVQSRLEEHVVVERAMTMDVDNEERRQNVSEGGGGDGTSMSDAYSEGSTRSTQRDSDSAVLLSALKSLVIGTRGEVEADSYMWEWMEDIRAQGMVVHLW